MSVTTGLTGLPNTSVTGFPAASVKVTVTPWMPGSPASWMPSRLVSDQTKSPTLTAGLMKPKSNVVSEAPSVVRSVDVADPVDESVAVVPAPVSVAM